MGLQGVSKRYSWRGPWVIREVTLETHTESFTAIVGGNGSGKSTLLRLAAGLTSPSAGVALVPTCISYVPEHQPGRLKFTSAEYLANMGRIKGLSSPAARTNGAELVERLGLQPNDGVQWDTLSKGNRQKLMLARVRERAPLIISHSPSESSNYVC